MEELHNSSVRAKILPPDTVIDNHYKIVRLIGAGGMASVYLAQDLDLGGQEVALKLLHKELTKDKTYLERFIREVNLMQQIEHENVCRVYEISTDTDLVYFAMEYVDGETLAQLMERRSFSIKEISRIVLDICNGLSAIHSKGIVHRDIKPENILISKEGVVKILDFGVARGEVSKLTTQLQRIGSIYYMAPELWRGEKPIPATDLYSLGVVIYEIVTGKLPFEQDFPGAIMKMHLDDKPVSPRKINPRIPDWLDSLVMRLLEKKAEKRGADAQEIAELVLKYTSEEDITSNYAQDSTPEGITTKRKNTYVFTLSATRVLDENQLASPEEQRKRRKATLVIPLSRRSAFIFEIEKPSKDFIFFGLFLISLQVMDGYLTSKGITRFGTEAEGNLLLRNMMEMIGPDNALLVAKAFAILLVIFLTVLAKRMVWIKNLINVLSYIYIIAAVIPWILILVSSS